MSVSGARTAGSEAVNQVPLSSDSPASWADAVATWESYKTEKKTENLVFVGTGEENHDEIRVAPYSHRFQQRYTQMQYGKIQGFIKGALSEYEDPYLVILTFSTSTTTPAGQLRPPIDHMDELLGTWGDGVYYELQRVMAGDRKRDPWEPREDWEYLYILEPTTDEGMVPGGYAHAHVGIVVDGAVEDLRFESVLDRHIQEAPNATGDAHELEDAIEVKKAEDLGNPGAYLFKYLGKSWNLEQMEDYERRFAALLFDQGRQRFRASNGAQRWMQRDEEDSEAGEWMFAGVATDEQAEQLREFEDYEDFMIATGQDVTGLRAWLQEEHAVRRANRRKEKDRQRSEMTEEEVWRLMKAGAPMPQERGDRPPPAGS